MVEIKQQIISQLIEDLTKEREVISKAAATAHSEATHPEAKPENRYDTRSLEASYLAGAQQARMEELTAKIEILRTMTLQTFTRDDAIAPSALIQLDCQGQIFEYFLTAWVSGYSDKINGRDIRIISSQSPFGAVMLGKTVGEIFSFSVGRDEKEYEILNIL